MKCQAAILPALLLTLTSCQGVFDFTAQAIEEKRLVNDGQAKIYVQAPCDMSIGAYHRVLTDKQREAVDLFCNPDLQTTTEADMQVILDFMELQSRSRSALNDDISE